MRLAIILFIALLVQGCGHKGPLTLPPAEASTTTTDK
jgi:predicted small lipoprotein YifL